MFEKKITKAVVKYGIGLGLFNIVFVLIMWLTELDTTYYEIGKKIELVISIVPIAVILYAIYEINKRVKLTLTKRLSVGVIIGLVSMIIAVPFTEIYHLYINPEWFDAVLRIQEQQMIDAGISQSEVRHTLESMEENNTALNSMIGAFAFGGLIFPALVSMISYTFIRTNKKDIQNDQ